MSANASNIGPSNSCIHFFLSAPVIPTVRLSIEVKRSYVPCERSWRPFLSQRLMSVGGLLVLLVLYATFADSSIKRTNDICQITQGLPPSLSLPLSVPLTAPHILYIKHIYIYICFTCRIWEQSVGMTLNSPACVISKPLKRREMRTQELHTACNEWAHDASMPESWSFPTHTLTFGKLYYIALYEEM